MYIITKLRNKNSPNLIYRTLPKSVALYSDSYLFWLTDIDTLEEEVTDNILDKEIVGGYGNCFYVISLNSWLCSNELEFIEVVEQPINSAFSPNLGVSFSPNNRFLNIVDFMKEAGRYKVEGDYLYLQVSNGIFKYKVTPKFLKLMLLED